MKTSTAEISARDRILDAAEDLFARRGYAGVGMSEIAEAVGLRKSSLFHHFRTKAQLHAATVVRILSQVDRELTRSLAQGGSAVERLDRWVDVLIDVLASTPSHARLLLRSLFEDEELSGDIDERREADEAIHRILQQVSHVLREGMSRGELRAANMQHTLQSLIGIIVYHFASGEFGDEIIGHSIFERREVERRKQEVKAFLHHGLVIRATGSD
jgi:TetR/AcrR family transcriptional regulator